MDRIAQSRPSPLLLSVVAALLLAAPGMGQEPPPPAAADHTVVRGETLWGLAGRYLGSPFDWPRIHDLNRDRIRDPHWIFPGQLFRIPGREGGQVTGLQVVPGGETPRFQAQEPWTGPAVFPGPTDRTVFTRDQRELIYRVVGAEEAPALAVSRAQFYSGGWIEPIDAGAAPPHEGRVTAFGTAGDVPNSARRTAGRYEELRLRVTGPRTPGVGEFVLTFRTGGILPEGRIILPTGLLEVVRIDEAGVVARVTSEYDRIRLDDYFVQAPPFPVEAGVEAVAVSDGREARIVGFARSQEFYLPGDVAFLDVGSAQGAAVGDEYTLFAPEGEGWRGNAAGRLRVVHVRGETAAARVMELDGPVFQYGTTVRHTARLP